MGHVASGVIGSLIGVLVGAWLAARWQRRQWVLDNKKAEYREICRVLDNFWWKVTDHRALYPSKPFSDFTNNEPKFTSMRALAESLSFVIGTLTSSIFLREDILRIGVVRDVQDLYHSWMAGNESDLEGAPKMLGEIKLQLLRMAWRDLGLRGSFPIEAPEFVQQRESSKQGATK